LFWAAKRDFKGSPTFAIVQFMPRASRYLREGYTYHLTHRCHDRRYLLKFAKDRDAYREWLRKAAKRYNVPVYSFTITSNHAHIIAHVDDVESVGLMMHLVAGAYAQQLNRRKDHEGSVEPA
jgi:putative transposase